VQVSSTIGARRSGGGASAGWIGQRLIGPRPFALDRMVAIYRAIVDASGACVFQMRGRIDSTTTINSPINSAIFSIDTEKQKYNSGRVVCQMRGRINSTSPSIDQYFNRHDISSRKAAQTFWVECQSEIHHVCKDKRDNLVLNHHLFATPIVFSVSDHHHHHHHHHQHHHHLHRLHHRVSLLRLLLPPLAWAATSTRNCRR
jgi:hypothetical protein